MNTNGCCICAGIATSGTSARSMLDISAIAIRQYYTPSLPPYLSCHPVKEFRSIQHQCIEARMAKSQVKTIYPSTTATDVVGRPILLAATAQVLMLRFRWRRPGKTAEAARGGGVGGAGRRGREGAAMSGPVQQQWGRYCDVREIGRAGRQPGEGGREQWSRSQSGRTLKFTCRAVGRSQAGGARKYQWGRWGVRRGTCARPGGPRPAGSAGHSHVLGRCGGPVDLSPASGPIPDTARQFTPAGESSRVVPSTRPQSVIWGKKREKKYFIFNSFSVDHPVRKVLNNLFVVILLNSSMRNSEFCWVPAESIISCWTKSQWPLLSRLLHCLSK